MRGVDENLLAGFGWLCLCAGEADRARALLDESWLTARSPNTYVLLMEAFERSRGITDSTPQTRLVEMARRQSMPDPAATEGRVRLALDSELDRLGLTKS